MIGRTLIVAALLATPASARVTAILHARAMPIVGAPAEDATILIEDGRIRAVAAHQAPPPGAEIIDAHGRIVTPGLFNPASQLGLMEVMEAEDTTDQSVSKGEIGPAFDVRYAINPNSTLIPVARADGVTRTMSYPGGAVTVPFSGQGAILHLVPDAPIVERGGAAMFAQVGIPTLSKAGGSRAAQWVFLRNAIAEVRHYAARPLPEGPRDQLLSRADLEALRPVAAGAMPLVIQADRESDIRQAIALATDLHVRVVIMGGAEAWHAAPALAAAHIPVILDPQADLPQTFDALGARLDNAALLARSGVTIAFCVPGNGIYTSYDAGIDMREGAGLAVANGLPYAEALRAITLAPAQIWGVDNVGTLAPGAEADIVIWDGDPLEPASAPSTVLVRGKPVSLATRQTLLRDRYAPARSGDAWPASYRR